MSQAISDRFLILLPQTEKASSTSVKINWYLSIESLVELTELTLLSNIILNQQVMSNYSKWTKKRDLLVF